MVKGMALQQVSAILGKALTAAKAPQIAVTQEAIRGAKQVSVELFSYDFVGLFIKLATYYGVAIIFAKFMEAVIVTRGWFVTAAAIFGWTIPTSEQVPESLKKLFLDGYGGFKFWDAVKIISILLVVAEMIRYTNSNKKNGGESSPLTLGIFILIIAVLGVVTIPELLQRIKKTDFNLESLK